MNEVGTLYLVATPIGNLEDISFRAVEILKKVDIIACEDKRETIKLLNNYEINNSLIDYHKFNEEKRADKLVERLLKGEDVALVSDAGMPVISDPGNVLVSRCNNENIPVRVVPGASAALSALLLSGMDARRFSFFGFPPKQKKEQKKFIEEISQCPNTVIIYESPHHLTKLLDDLREVIPERKISVSREITKLHEETLRGTVEEIAAHFQTTPPRGEFVIVIEAAENEKAEDELMYLSVPEHVAALVKRGVPEKQAIKEVAATRGLKKRAVYETVKVKNAKR